MAKYYLTNKAVEDLSEIWDYTIEVWSEMQAENYYGLLLLTCVIWQIIHNLEGIMI
ncbi:type II toxin-antitoxin system RelE/ParE family toxin [Flavobacterium sp. RS13.1]|jgi:toxin ParE1/3/4|uniref:type II toxin-antitoxin system RelE/ParE family toxin n=1 Tax=Flavobacterium sp. RS13.1 TaxID=3400345 RepID=UPI003AAC0ED9